WRKPLRLKGRKRRGIGTGGRREFKSVDSSFLCDLCGLLFKFFLRTFELELNDSEKIQMTCLRRFAVCAGILLSSVALLAAPQADKTNKAAKEALAQFNTLIGGWRGTAQPKRGSAAGSWRESAEWVWDFS